MRSLSQSYSSFSFAIIKFLSAIISISSLDGKKLTRMLKNIHRRLVASSSPKMSITLTRIATILIVQITCQQVVSAIYDPEQQDGIPIFSARSSPIEASSAPSIISENDWPSVGESIVDRARGPAGAQRRRSDEALEEDDEDEDSYPSGSSARESVENPSYGESRRAEKDGDEIEDFFDKHLGAPHHEGAQSSAAGDESRAVARVAEVPAVDPDDDDDHETAASGPIASFLHNLIFHNGDEKPSAAASNTTAAGTNGKRTAPLIIHAFGSGHDKEESQAGKTGTRVVQTMLAPLVASPSSIVNYEPQAATSDESLEDGHGAASPPTGTDGIQEIYIGRRPTVMSYLQQTQHVQQTAGEEQQKQQFSPQHQQMAYYQHPHTAAGSANVWRTQNMTPQMAGYQQVSALPVAAAYAHHYPVDAAAASTPGSETDSGDEQMVTYGLSFGSRSHVSSSDNEAGDNPVSAQGNSGDSEPHGSAGVPQEHMGPMMARAQQHYYQQQVSAGSGGGYVPYSARYGGPPSSRDRYSNSYYQQELMPAQRQFIMSHQRQQRDPNSEAMSRAAAYQHTQAYHAAAQKPSGGSQQQYR